MSKTYILNRCRPMPEGAWDGTKTYLELSVVYDTVSGDSYISKIPVPAGTPLSNTTYWVMFSNYATNALEYGKSYPTVADMRMDAALQVGGVVSTLGFYEVGDGGAGTYIIVQGVYVDGGKYQQIAGTDKYAELVFNDTVSIKQLGAKGDGVTDDSITIQGAIDFLTNKGGGTVIIPSSPEPFIYSYIVVKDDITLKGEGGVLKLADQTTADTTQTFYTLHNMGFDHVRYEGLIVDMNKANNPSPVVADALTIGGDRSHVLNCLFYNVVDSAIMFSGATNCSIKGCTILDSFDCGIYVNHGAATADPFRDNLIEGNWIQNCMTGIALKRDSQNVIITENTLRDCQFGITNETGNVADGDYSLNNTISDNRIISGTIRPTQVGIILRNSDYTICTGNRIDGFTNQGIGMNGGMNMVVSNNVITSTIDASATTNSCGIQINERNDAFGVKGVIGSVVEGNIITVWCQRGIFCMGTGNANMLDNNISNNFVNNLGNMGITVGASFIDCTISCNTFSGALYDVEMTAGSTNNFFGNKLGHETITGSTNPETMYMKHHAISKISMGVGAPTNGSWKRGDIVYNKNVGSGAPMGWVCTADGEAGTWAALPTV